MLSVEPWLVELLLREAMGISHRRFSALSRAVVGGTPPRGVYACADCSFSALSRAVVGGT